MYDSRVRWLGQTPIRQARLGDPSPWYDGGCSSGPRVRFTDDGQIEVEGGGIPTGKLASGVNQWSELIWKYSNQYSLWAHFVAGIMSLESQGDQNAVSSAKACGLMQLIEPTATSLAGRKITCAELTSNPDLNVQLGCKNLDALTTRYNGNPIKLSVAYNAGGARCGCPCKTRAIFGDRTSPCVECLCNPNQWNLVTDCHGSTAVDYPMIVFKLANSAWNGAFHPSKNPLLQVPQTDEQKACAGLGGTWDAQSKQCLLPGVSAGDTCLNKGGTWDDQAKICTMPVPRSSGGGGSDDSGLLILGGLALVGVIAAMASKSASPRAYR